MSNSTPLSHDPGYVDRVFHNATQADHLRLLEAKQFEITGLRNTLKALLIEHGPIAISKSTFADMHDCHLEIHYTNGQMELSVQPVVKGAASVQV